MRLGQPSKAGAPGPLGAGEGQPGLMLTDPNPKHQSPSEQNGSGGGGGGEGVQRAPVGPAFRPNSCSGPWAPARSLSPKLRLRGLKGAGRRKSRKSVSSVLAPGKPFVWGPEPSSPEVSVPTTGNTMPPLLSPRLPLDVGSGKGRKGQGRGQAASRTRPSCRGQSTGQGLPQSAVVEALPTWSLKDGAPSWRQGWGVGPPLGSPGHPAPQTAREAHADEPAEPPAGAPGAA